MEAIPVHAAGGVLVTRQDEEWNVLLVQKRQSGFWMLPKGHLEEGESTEEAAQREVREETGYGVVLGPFIGDISFSYNRDSLCFVESVCFYLMTPKDQTNKWDDCEIQQIKWYSFEEAGEILAFPAENGILQKGRNLLEGWLSTEQNPEAS